MTVITHPKALEAFRKLEGQAFQRGARRYQPMSARTVVMVAVAAFLAGAASAVIVLSLGAPQ
jgi:hypothetical protein